MSHVIHHVNLADVESVLRALTPQPPAEGLGFRLDGHVTARCLNPDGTLAWEVDQSNLVTDFGRRLFANSGLGALSIFTSPSTETPVAQRYALTDNGGGGAGQQSGLLTPTVDTITVTRAWTTSFNAPAQNRLIGSIGLGSWASTLGAYGIVAFTKLASTKTQTTLQTLEVVYRITVTATV